MVVEHGKIKYVGTNKGAMAFNRPGTTRVINVKGKTILPGFHDVHVHPLEASNPAAGTCELPSDTSPSQMVNLFKRRRCQDDQVGTDWVIGFGHSIGNLLEFEENGGSPRFKLN